MPDNVSRMLQCIRMKQHRLYIEYKPGIMHTFCVMFCFAVTDFTYNDHTIRVRSPNCGCLVTWFCYLMIAKPGNKTATVSWPDPYVEYMQRIMHTVSWCCFVLSVARSIFTTSPPMEQPWRIWVNTRYGRRRTANIITTEPSTSCACFMR